MPPYKYKYFSENWLLMWWKPFLCFHRRKPVRQAYVHVLNYLKSNNHWSQPWNTPYLVVSESPSRHHSVSHWTTWPALRGEWSHLSGVRSGFTTMSWKSNINIIHFVLGIRSYLFLASFEHNRAGWCHWKAPDAPFWGVKWLVETCFRWYVTCWWIKRKKMWCQIRTSWLFYFMVNHQGCYTRQDMRIGCFSHRCKNIISFVQFCDNLLCSQCRATSFPQIMTHLRVFTWLHDVAHLFKLPHHQGHLFLKTIYWL